ncbi:hypothetical protein C8J57DRAFT_1303696 [Mycena rebaudengoi]|nr:hypothetical protein C8J57DRAFT_1303696 [Mycena rebaudengoi]
MSVAPKAGDAADAGGLMRLRPHDGLGAPEYTGRATNGGHAIHRARHRGGHRHPCRRPRALTPAKLADFEVTESFATAAYVPIRPRLRGLHPYRPLRLRRVPCLRRLVRPYPLLRPRHPPLRTPTLAHAARTPLRSRAGPPLRNASTLPNPSAGLVGPHLKALELAGRCRPCSSCGLATYFSMLRDVLFVSRPFLCFVSPLRLCTPFDARSGACGLQLGKSQVPSTVGCACSISVDLSSM